MTKKKKKGKKERGKNEVGEADGWCEERINARAIIQCSTGHTTQTRKETYTEMEVDILKGLDRLEDLRLRMDNMILLKWTSAKKNGKFQTVQYKDHWGAAVNTADLINGRVA